MEETVVIRGLTRQAKIVGLPLPYAMAVAGLWMVPFMVGKSLWLLLTLPVWYIAARSVVAINPNAHRILTARVTHLPQSFQRGPVRFARSTKGRSTDV